MKQSDDTVYAYENIYENVFNFNRPRVHSVRVSMTITSGGSFNFLFRVNN
jgi:hypothetical protein